MLQIGIFVAVTAGSMTLFWVLTGHGAPARARFRRRLAAEFGTAAPGAAVGPLYKNLDAPTEPDRTGDTSGTWRAWAEEFLRQAGVPLSVRGVLGIVVGAGILGGVLGLVFGGPLIGAGATVAGALAPLMALKARRTARREKYLKQLIGAFELMARVMRAGQSVSEAFRAAVESFDDPLGSEFGRCLHQIEHGLRPEAAFRELSQRAGILELRIFVMAVTIQRQAGGNLSDVLDRLGSVVRARVRVRQKIRALTAEGRLQSLTLTVLPVLTFGVMYFLNRSYAESLLVQWRLLAATVGCMIVGTLWIRNIMNFEG